MELFCVDEHGGRPVNDIETEALKFTFGEEIGNCLIGFVKVKYDPIVVELKAKGAVGNETEILMRSDYDPNDLEWLSVFIHEAVHIWQRNTGLHLEEWLDLPPGEQRDYRYYYPQLPKLELKVEELSSAIEHWFFVKFGIKKNVFQTEADLKWLWRWLLQVFGFEARDWPVVAPPPRGEKEKPEVKHGLDGIQKLLKVWDPVIEKIRDPKHMPEWKCTRAEVPYPGG